jgi:hypothetical protein
MESNRTARGLNRASLGRQAGITAIGFLILAAVFGTLGLAVLKIFPLYMEKMRVGTVLENVERELAGGGNTRQGILSTLESSFYIENLEIDRSEIDISQQGAGYLVSINRESRAPFFADLWFVVAIDEQIEINR